MARRGLGYAASSASDLRAHVTDTCKSHFFSRGAKRFFKSKLVSVYPGQGKTCFVTSEQQEGHPRRFTVKKLVGCQISTVGEFQQYSGADTARMAAKSCARAPGLDGVRKRRR